VTTIDGRYPVPDSDGPGSNTDKPQRAGRPMLDVARVLVLVGALSIVAVGFLAGSMGILTSALGPADARLTMITLSVSFMALTTGLGSALAWQAIQAMQGRSSGPFRARRAWVLGLFFLLAVFTGNMLLQLDLLPALTFPPMHVLAGILPPLTIVALVGHTLGGISRWRDVVLQISSGAFLSTFLAFFLESTILLSLLISILVIVALQPGGLEGIQRLVDQLQDPSWQQSPVDAGDLFKSPIFVALIFLAFAGIVPLIEEAVKTIGLGLMAYRRPGLAEAMLWGVAGGAGFGLAEGLFNSAGGLDAWAPIVLLRVGASLLHCFTGALMGLAWYAALARRRWIWALGLYAASVGVHGLWNALTATMALLSLGATGSQATGLEQIRANVGAITAGGLLVLLALLVGLGLVGLVRYVRQRDTALNGPSPGPGTPTSSTSLAAGSPGEGA